MEFYCFVFKLSAHCLHILEKPKNYNLLIYVFVYIYTIWVRVILL